VRVPRVPSSNSDVMRTWPCGISMNGNASVQFRPIDTLSWFVH